MMISLIVVALVGIGFTRLTMLALELRDNFDEARCDGVGITHALDTHPSWMDPRWGGVDRVCFLSVSHSLVVVRGEDPTRPQEMPSFLKSTQVAADEPLDMGRKREQGRVCVSRVASRKANTLVGETQTSPNFAPRRVLCRRHRVSQQVRRGVPTTEAAIEGIPLNF